MNPLRPGPLPSLSDGLGGTVFNSKYWLGKSPETDDNWYPPGNYNIPPWEKEHHRLKSPAGKGYEIVPWGVTNKE